MLEVIEGRLEFCQVNKVGRLFCVVLSSLVDVLSGGKTAIMETSRSKDIKPQGREWELSSGANVNTSKMVWSIKSRGREVTVRTGESITESVTAQSETVCVREWFRLRLWKWRVLDLPFSVIPVVYYNSGHSKLVQSFSGFNRHMNHLEIMLKMQMLIHCVWSGAWGSTFLTGSQWCHALSPCTSSRKGLKELRVARQRQRKQLIWGMNNY